MEEEIVNQEVIKDIEEYMDACKGLNQLVKRWKLSDEQLIELIRTYRENTGEYWQDKKQ